MAVGKDQDRTPGAKLELNLNDLRARTKRLFDQLDEDVNARSAFLADPLTHVAELYGVTADRQVANSANRILFTMLSNDRFRTWLECYPAERDGKPIERSEFARDFARALIDYGDPDIIDNLLRHAAEGFGLPGFQEVAQQFVTGPEKSVVTPAATPSSSSAKVESSQNFEHKGFGLGDLSVINPAQFRAIMEQLIERAKQLSEAGELRAALPARR